MKRRSLLAMFPSAPLAVEALASTGAADLRQERSAGRQSLVAKADVKSVKDFGAVGDGRTDDTKAIQAAIDAVGRNGGTIVFPPGAYLLTEGLTIVAPRYLRLVGAGGARGSEVTALYCKGLSSYVFAPSGLGKQLILEDLVFDGCNGVVPSHESNSSSWRGVVSCNQQEFANLKVVRVSSFGSNAAYPMWDLRKAFFSYFDNCSFSNWHLHRILQISGGTDFTGTTATFHKCYFSYAREIAYLQDVLDCQFRSCVFESSVVALAIFGGTTLVEGCYFENIGYDNSGTIVTSGVTSRAFGVADGPSITGNASAAVTARHGQTTFLNCRLSSLGGTCVSWFDGVGRGNAIDAGGVFRLVNTSHTYTGDAALFAQDPDSRTRRGDFEYIVEGSTAFREYLKYADARLCAAGRFKIAFSDGTRRLVTADQGRFRVPQESTLGFTAMPTVYPYGGRWSLGDEVVRSYDSQAAGKVKSWICTRAGSPGKWDVLEFIPISYSASIPPAGNSDFGGTLDGDVGDTHVWEITASRDGSSLEYHATAVVCIFYKDRSVNVTEHVGVLRATVALSDKANTYSLRYTNKSASKVNIYARLIRAYSVRS